MIYRKIAPIAYNYSLNNPINILKKLKWLSLCEKKNKLRTTKC